MQCNSNNSIYRSSFLHDKKLGEKVQFRIVTLRDISKSLSFLGLDRNTRNDDEEKAKLTKSITTSSKRFKSPAGNDACFWVNNTLWQIPGKLASLEATNKKKLLQLAEKYGINPSSSQNDTLYEDILDKAYKAGNASKVKTPNEKIITFENLNVWWKLEIDELKKNESANKKPYTNQADPFLIEFHSFTSDDLKKAVIGLEAGYEQKIWRNSGLAVHMMDWLPEIALKASEVSVLNHSNFLQYSEKARKAIKKHIENAGEELISEILLHICLRQTFNSEPIACKVFYLSKDKTSKSFPNAHIVHLHNKDELWLGKSTIIYLEDFEESIKSFMGSIKDYLNVDFLKQERQIILDLKESQHLFPSTIENIFLKNTSIDEFIDHLCLPILILYDSPHLNKGHIEDYKKHLINEVKSNFNHLMKHVPLTLSKIKIHIFLLPFDHTKILLSHFNDLLN